MGVLTLSGGIDDKNAKALTKQFIKVSETDNAESGYCARGVGNILDKMGVGFTRGNAHAWDDTLPKSGWVQLKIDDPADAPPTSVLVYDRKDNWADLDSSNKKNYGAIYGHVEIVGMNEDGSRTYISDRARKHAGGSDPARDLTVWVHPDLLSQNGVDRLTQDINDGHCDAWRAGADGAENDYTAANDYFGQEFSGGLLTFLAVIQALFSPNPEDGQMILKELLQPQSLEPAIDNVPSPSM